MGSLTYKDFKVKTDINDERLEKLKTYLNLIKIWQKKFNLISQKSFESIWERHFLDSYQILKLIGNKKRILDIGSGAGFPAIVCAICSNNNFDLVEINQKKCNFLNEVKNKKVPIIVPMGLDENNNILPNGELGRIILTDLNNKAFPFECVSHLIFHLLF